MIKLGEHVLLLDSMAACNNWWVFRAKAAQTKQQKEAGEERQSMFAPRWASLGKQNPELIRWQWRTVCYQAAGAHASMSLSMPHTPGIRE